MSPARVRSCPVCGSTNLTRLDAGVVRRRRQGSASHVHIERRWECRCGVVLVETEKREISGLVVGAKRYVQRGSKA